MKKIILACLTSATLFSAQAQLFSPESFGGALWGGLIGGVVGANHRHGFSGNGAAIGAGVGFLAGSLVGESRSRYYHSSYPHGYVYTSGPGVAVGYGYTPYVYYAPNAYCAPGYYYQPPRPNYAVGGTIVGAASGALIGAGNHDAGKGAAIGAAAGLVLGTAAEINAQRREQHWAEAQTTTVVQSAPAPQTQPPEIPQSPPQVTSQPCASSTYHWTPRPQIADAPRVPDAPTF